MNFKKMKKKERTFLCQVKTQGHNAREHLVTSNLCLLLMSQNAAN